MIGAGALTFGGWLGGTLVNRNFISVEHRYANAGKWKEITIERQAAQEPGGAFVAKADELKVDQMKLIRLDDGTRIALARTEQGYRRVRRSLHPSRRIARGRGAHLRARAVPVAWVAV